MKIFVDRNWIGRFRFYINDNGEHSYYADDGLLIFKGDYAKVYNKKKERELNVIRKGSLINLNESKFLIQGIKTGDAIEVSCKSYKNGHWTINVGTDDYELYYHGRLKKSLFKNGMQVGKFIKTEHGDYIISNNDEVPIFLIGIFMAFQMGDSSPDHDVVLDIHGDAKDATTNWQPVK